MPMHDLPRAVFRPKDGRNTEGYRRGLLAPGNLGAEALHLYEVGKIAGDVLRDGLESGGLTVAVDLCSRFHRLGDLLPSSDGRAKRVRDGHVVRCEYIAFNGSGFPITNSPSAR